MRDPNQQDEDPAAGRRLQPGEMAAAGSTCLSTFAAARAAAAMNPLRRPILLQPIPGSRAHRPPPSTDHLFPRCHRMQQFGLAAVLDVLSEQDVAEYLVAMNDWSVAEARDHMADAQGLWRDRSRYEWRINTDAIALTVDDALLERAAERQPR